MMAFHHQTVVFRNSYVRATSLFITEKNTNMTPVKADLKTELSSNRLWPIIVITQCQIELTNQNSSKNIQLRQNAGKHVTCAKRGKIRDRCQVRETGVCQRHWGVSLIYVRTVL